MKEQILKEKSIKIVNVLSQLDNNKEIYSFIRDLLSPKEIEEFSRRLEVAELLHKKISYTKIEEQTGMSSTTIARISKFLNGKNKGYKKALSILKYLKNNN